MQPIRDPESGRPNQALAPKRRQEASVYGRALLQAPRPIREGDRPSTKDSDCGTRRSCEYQNRIAVDQKTAFRPGELSLGKSDFRRGKEFVRAEGTAKASSPIESWCGQSRK